MNAIATKPARRASRGFICAALHCRLSLRERAPSRRSGLWFVCAVLGVLAAAAHPARAEDAERGLFVTVFNPITDASITQIQGIVDRNRNQGLKPLRIIVFEFNPVDEQGKALDAATDNFYSCASLADYIKTLNDNGISTVAFVANKVTRHTVLPVLACKDVVMAQDAKIGDVAKPDSMKPEQVQLYAKYAGPDREAAVLRMIYPNLIIAKGIRNGQPIYVDPAKAEQMQVVVLNKVSVKPPGQSLWDVNEALTFGICRESGQQTREDVANFYKLDPASLRGDPWMGRKPKACKIELFGIINEEMKASFLNQLREVRAKKENTVFLLLDCGGGVAKVAWEIADELRRLEGDDKKPIRTIAFIPSRAPDLATFIAFGCSEIIMYKGSDKESEATLGDFSQFLGTMAASKEPSNTIQFIRDNLHDLAAKQGYPKLVVDAMLDEKMTLLQVKSKQGTILELMTPQILEAKGKNNFNQPRTLKQAGSLLKLDATLAKELRIAQDTVNNRDIKEVYSRYGVAEKDVRDSKPSWVDDFAAFLRRTFVSILLVIIGFAALILEVKMPGATIPGLISLVCFVLFFWAWAYQNDATIWLALALFLLGLILIGVEIFILPGFGVTGICGVILIVAGIALATLEKAPDLNDSDSWGLFASRLLRYGLTLVASGVLVVVFARYIHKIPYANRLMLEPPPDGTDADGEFAPLPGAEEAAALLGKVGVATSMLRPAGMAKVGDVYVDVVTEGDFIEPGTPIQVVEVEGNRIVVKKV